MHRNGLKQAATSGVPSWPHMSTRHRPSRSSLAILGLAITAVILAIGGLFSLGITNILLAIRQSSGASIKGQLLSPQPLLLVIDEVMESKNGTDHGSQVDDDHHVIGLDCK